MERILFISPSTQDKRSWALTLIIGILPTAFFGWKIIHHSSGFVSPWILSFALFLIMSIVGFICTPYKYILINTHLIVKRYWRDISIPLREIKTVGIISDKEKKTMWRSFGYSGPFGYFGFFRSAHHTKLRVFARRYNNWMMLITVDGKKYVIAPDDAGLINALAAQIEHPESLDEPMENMKTKLRRISIKVVIALCVFAPLISIIPTYREPKVICDAARFRVNGFYGIDILLADIAAVDTIAWKEMPAFPLRTGGVSLPGVHRGNFRTKDGDKARLSIRSGSDPVIRIIDRSGKAYYLNRKDPAETRRIFEKLQSESQNPK